VVVPLARRALLLGGADGFLVGPVPFLADDLVPSADDLDDHKPSERAGPPNIPLNGNTVWE
jgi:hypothetical protein